MTVKMARQNDIPPKRQPLAALDSKRLRMAGIRCRIFRRGQRSLASKHLEVGNRVYWIDRDSLSKLGGGAGAIPNHSEHDAIGRMIGGIVWIQFDRAPNGLDSFLRLVLFQQDLAEQNIRVRRNGIEPNRFPRVFLRLGVLLVDLVRSEEHT